MAYNPWLTGILTRGTLWGDDGTGTYRPVQVDANGAISVSLGGGTGVVTVTPEASSTWETLLVNDTVVLQAEIQEGVTTPGMTTVLVTGGLDRGRYARNHAVDADGRLMVSVKGTIAPRWSSSQMQPNVGVGGKIICAIKHKGNINSTPTTLLAYLDSIGTLVEVGGHVDVILNPTIANVTWADIETANSFMQANTNIAINMIGGSGRVIYGVDVGANKGADSYGMANVDVSNYAITLNPNDILVFFAAAASSSGIMRVTANWHEAP